MDMPTPIAQHAELPPSVYYILGFLVLGNISTIVTILFAAFKVVYNYAVLQTQTKALHRRVDLLENKRHPADTECESES